MLPNTTLLRKKDTDVFNGFVFVLECRQLGSILRINILIILAGLRFIVECAFKIQICG